MIFDTTFLIDLHRESRRNKPGAAFRFLESHPDTAMCISVLTYAEFAEGFSAEQEAACAELLRAYRVFEVNEDIGWVYARSSRRLRASGARLSDNDIWIASTAIYHEVELVTRDGNHFRRIEGLTVLDY
jgi:tRNA(fMet)-specific endonuclease VapC